MADTFRNPYNYTSPIGAALADLTRTIISGPSRAEKIAAAETARLKQAEASAAIRENEAIAKLAAGFGAFGTDGFDRSGVMSSAILGGYDPADLAEMERYGAANTFGAMDPRTTNAQMGAGDPFSGTFAGFSQDQSNQNMRAANTLAETRRNNMAVLGENARQFDMDPLAAVVNGKPVYVPQSGAFDAGISPVISETENKAIAAQNLFPNLTDLEQRRYIGVDPSMSDFANLVGPNGVTVADPAAMQSVVGQPGYSVVGKDGAAGDAGITTSTKTRLEGAQIGIDRATRMLDYVEGLALKDPTNFGLTGEAKGLGQDIGQLAANVATGLGFTGIQEAINAVQQDALQSGVTPTTIQSIFTFDPNLGELQGAYGMLVYSLAEGIAGQAGRELSDADVARAQAAFGNPRAIFASQQSVLASLKAARTMLGINREVVGNALGGAPPAAGQPAPDGIPTVASPEEAMALPSGTKFRTPDGRVKVRP